MKICLRPKPGGIAGGGVRRRLDALWKHLPTHGVQFVNSPNKADLVHCHAIAEAQGYAHSMVYTNHGVYELTEDSPKHEWAMNAIIVRNLRLARRVISVAEWPTRIYEGGLGISANVIPNGVDLDEWDAVPKGQFIKKRKLKRPFALWAKVVNTGVCDPTPALELARRLPQLDIVSTFAPQGASNLPPNFKVVGRLPYDEMKTALADCALNLATTRENFAVQTVEAMALGKPILAFDWGGNPEAIRDGVEGRLVAPGDYDALAQAALDCLENAEQYGEDARSQVEAHYQWKNLIAQVYQVYEAALEERRRERAAPRVVVVVPNYEYHRFLPEALESIQKQTFQNFECKIVDDGSPTDPEPHIKKYLKDPRFELVRQENMGVAGARNAGIAASNAPYAMCLDADDVLEPQALKVLVPVLDADEGLGVAYGQMHWLRVDGTHSPCRGWPRPWGLEALKRGNLIPTCCLFRRRAWRAAGEYPEDPPGVDGWSWEDYELWMRMASKGWAGRLVDRLVFHYRQHPGGTSRIAGATGQVSQFQALIRRRNAEMWAGPTERPIGTYDFKNRMRSTPEEAAKVHGRRLVRYSGKKRGNITFRSPVSGTTYRFNASSPQHWVDECDLPYLRKQPRLVVGEAFPDRVTVVVPCHNHAEFLAEALDSVLGQDYAHVEVVVIDDGSDDGTGEVMERYQGLPNLTYVRHQENQGLAAARNTGIARAKKGFILPLDADDVLAPNCVSSMMREMQRAEGGNAVVYADFWFMGETPKNGQHYELEDYDFTRLLNKNLMSATSLFPREAWEKAGGYKEVFSKLGGWEDYEFWVNLGKLGYCGRRIARPLWGYRQHKNSMRKGAMRNKRAIQAEMMRIHSDVYGGERPMGCCGGKTKSTRRGGGGRAANGAARMGTPGAGILANSSRAIGMAPLVEVRYAGNKKGSFAVRGKATGTFYRFSALAPEKYVDRRDAEAGLGAQFAIVVPAPEPPPKEAVVMQPPELELAVQAAPPEEKPLPKPKAEPEPVRLEPFDFTKLKGVGPGTATALKRLGMNTLEDLAYADTEEVAEKIKVPGNKVNKVKRWQRRAAELLGDDDPFGR